MKTWEHFHIAVPVTDPPPGHSERLTKRLTQEMRLTMSREAVVEHLGRTDSEREPLPEIPNMRSVGVILFWLGALAGILGGLILDKLFG